MQNLSCILVVIWCMKNYSLSVISRQGGKAEDRAWDGVRVRVRARARG